MKTTNILATPEIVNDIESTNVRYEIHPTVEAFENFAEPIAKGTHTLRHGGCDEIRAKLLAACIADLERQFNAVYFTGCEVTPDLAKLREEDEKHARANALSHIRSGIAGHRD